MTSKVFKTLLQYNMLSKGDTVGIGLSGGADSVALLHFFATHKDELDIGELKAIHIHHGIRGKEADRDLEFSKELCKKLGVSFEAYYVNVPDEAEKTGEGIEECARRIRYSIFEDSQCDKIATAHNMNDNMETFFFNLSRGASLSGLCSIPYVRDFYIRPLLDCTRAEIEDYLKANNLSFVTDSTNLCDDYTRNKIRHNILPLFFELNPSFDKAFSKSNEAVKLSKNFIDENARALFEKSVKDGYYDCTVFENSHIVLKREVVSIILKAQGIKNINREHIDSILHIIEKDGSVNVSGAVVVRTERKKLYFGEMRNIDYFEIGFDVSSKVYETPVGEYKSEVFLKKDLHFFNKQAMDNFIDCDKISVEMLLRLRREGESYRPKGRMNKSLKKLFNESKIPVSQRSSMLILSDEKGIVWTELFGVADRCKADENTERFLKITKVG